MWNKGRTCNHLGVGSSKSEKKLLSGMSLGKEKSKRKGAGKRKKTRDKVKGLRKENSTHRSRVAEACSLVIYLSELSMYK